MAWWASWVAGVLVAGPAAAWEHTGHAWPVEDFPLPYYTSDDGTEDCAGLPPGTCRAEAEAAWQAWADAGICGDFSGVDAGFRPVPPGSGVNHSDSQSSIAFDVADVEPGVLAFAATQTRPDSAFWLDGVRYVEASETDIVVSRDWLWATQAEAEAPGCFNRFNLRGVLVHELGHLAGLGHSCEENQPCSADGAAAIMNWSADTCEIDEITEDDRAGLNALYGPSASFVCGDSDDPVIVDTAPLTLECRITHSTLPFQTATWRFGDGALGDGERVTHTWTTAGQFGVEVVVEGRDDTCGPWRYEADRFGYLRLCEPADADFHVEQLDSTTWDLLNDTPLRVFGCVTGVHWAVYEGRRARGAPVVESWNWELTHSFPHEGPWTAVLEVSGESGTATEQVTFGGPDPILGCSCAHGGPGGWLAWLGPLLLAVRRHGRVSSEPAPDQRQLSNEMSKK